MNKFKQYKLEISDKHELLVNNYLHDIKEYISKNNLDIDLYDDIEERVFEKLSDHKKLTDLVIKQILNDIGKPQDIFEDELENDKNNLVHTILANIKTLIYNIKKTTAKIFETGLNIKNIFIFIKTILVNIFSFLKKIIVWKIGIFKKLLSLTGDTMKYILKNACIIIKKLFLGFGSIIGYLILGISLLMTIAVPTLLNGLEVGNIDYLASIPEQFYYAYAAIILAVAGIGVFFIVKKRFLFHFAFSILGIVMALGFIFSGTTQLYNDFGFSKKYTQEFKLSPTQSVLHMKQNDIKLYGKMYIFDEIIENYDIEILPHSATGTIIEIETEIFSKDEASNKIVKDNLSNLEVELVGNNLQIALERQNLFKEKQNLVPVNREIRILIPESQEINLGRYDWNYRFLRQFPNCYDYSYHEDKVIKNIKGSIACESKDDEKQEDTSIQEQELENVKFERDKKKWSFMKDLMNAQNTYKTDNGKFAENLSDLELYLYNKANFSLEEIQDIIDYTIYDSANGLQNRCYEFSIGFESQEYIKHLDEKGKFRVGNTNEPICKKEEN